MLVKWRGSSYKTKVIKKSLNPKWEATSSTFTFEDDEAYHSGDWALNVTVMDHDRFGSNDFMGQCSVNLADIVGGDAPRGTSVTRKQWFKLADKTGIEDDTLGEIKLHIVCNCRPEVRKETPVQQIPTIGGLSM